ncbi:hypothetical protein H6F98_10190 [Microcoleus sp. FACHB-SPT15]|uniref:hypothetical protein n=1 Tax=Microcoleus sp. FACHB-SPT15 TaxID=2692830 RepID=UPI00177AA682|nr:hypothetical protein [Microcoleus sp. FACHB-SPT15]MBD1805819.1 hypothetical protein [Microcoleus sp. FACHB-SPT15]
MHSFTPTDVTILTNSTFENSFQEDSIWWTSDFLSSQSQALAVATVTRDRDS